MEEGVDVEAFYVCDIIHKFASLGQLCRGVHQDSQIWDKNHIFVTSLASFFVTDLASFFVFATHKINCGITPLSNESHFSFLFGTSADTSLTPILHQVLFQHFFCKHDNHSIMED